VTQKDERLAKELTAWERILLEKAIAAQLGKKCHTFHGTPMFIATLITICHCELIRTC
jgi:hypothetical protein